VSRDPSHAPFWKKFGGHVRLVHEKMSVKFEVCNFNYMKLLEFNPQNLGVMWPWPRPLFEKKFLGHIRIVPEKMCLSI